MEHLEKFKKENIKSEYISEIANLSNEELEYLANEKTILLIRDVKSKNTTHTGLATYKSLLSLRKLNLMKNYEIVGIATPKNNVIVKKEEAPAKSDFIAPEKPLFEQEEEEEELEFENFEEETEVVEKQKRGRKPNK